MNKRPIDRGFKPLVNVWSVERLNNLSKIAGVLAILIAMAATTIYSLTKPDNNWDMIPYIATALNDRYSDPLALHTETWRQVIDETSKDELNALQYGDHYRRAQWESPENFISQLSMYHVKIGYVQLLRLIEPYTGLVQGGHLLSLAAALLSGVVILLLLVYYNALQAGLLVAPALLISGYSSMAAAVFPDMVLAALSFAAIAAFLRERDWLAAILLVAAFMIRPDNIIMTFALLLTAVLFGWRQLPLLLAFVVSVVAGLYISNAAGHIGWWAHLYFACIEMQPSLNGFKPDFSIVLLIKTYVRGVILALTLESWPSMLLVAMVGWAATAKAGVRTNITRLNGIAFAMVIGILGKFVYFPMPYDRFFFNMIIILVLVLSLGWVNGVNLKGYKK